MPASINVGLTPFSASNVEVQTPRGAATFSFTNLWTAGALAIGTTGSLVGAARSLGVNHTTVLRRLDALEARLGSRLFDRKRSGYQPTEAGLALLEQARHMATRADEVERQVLGRDRELSGVLRVTTAFVLMDHLLPQPLADFSRAYPGIEVEVLENAFLADLRKTISHCVSENHYRRFAERAAQYNMGIQPECSGPQQLEGSMGSSYDPILVKK